MDEFGHWKSGARAFADGQNRKKNPYPRHSDQWESWNKGWVAARNHWFLVSECGFGGRASEEFWGNE